MGGPARSPAQLHFIGKFRKQGVIMVAMGSFFILLLNLVDGHLCIGTRCPEGWTYYGQSCWKPVAAPADNITYHGARRLCGELDSSLAVPKTAGQNSFLLQFFQSTWPAAVRALWLGCTATTYPVSISCNGDMDSSHEFYTFVPQNTSTTAGTKCVMMLSSRNHMGLEGGVWVSGGCYSHRYAICEQPALAPSRELSKSMCVAVPLADGYSCLEGHTFAVLTTRRPEVCCLLCSKNPNCFSFTLSGSTCRLNNVTKDQVDQGTYFKLQDGCVYYEML